MLSLAAMKMAAFAAVAGLSGLAIFGQFTGRPMEPEMVRVERAGGGALAVAKFEVSWIQWKQCHDAGGCAFLPDPGMPAAGQSFPVTGVNRLDVEQFIGWLNGKSGKTYRLPTQAEWREIAAEIPRPKRAKLFSDPRLAWAADYGSMQQVSARIESAGHFGAVGSGIADLAGNVWEWTSTCAVAGFDAAACPAFVAEGAHETSMSVFVRDPAFGGCAIGLPPANIGFRLVSTDPV